MQKAGYRQGADALQQVQAPQTAAGGPIGPGTPRAPAQPHSSQRDNLLKDSSFDLGSFLAN